MSSTQKEDDATKNAPSAAPTGEEPVPKAAVSQAKKGAAKKNRATATRVDVLPSGIVGAQMSEIERAVPFDEPPPLAVNSALKCKCKCKPL
jgi:hypothetical protein